MAVADIHPGAAELEAFTLGTLDDASLAGVEVVIRGDKQVRIIDTKTEKEIKLVAAADRPVSAPAPRLDGAAGVPLSDADDLIQEVLLVVFREVGGFERRGEGAFRAWLRIILAHRVRDYFRTGQHRPTAAGGSDFLRSLDELESPDSGLSRLWDREHDEHVAASLLRRVQGDFAPATWQAFCRHVLEGEPAVRVAEELNLSLNSVLLAKSRVLKRLRQELAGFVE